MAIAEEARVRRLAARAVCCLHQGDGADVAALVATMSPPPTLYVDFDRTLCSTRGGSPLKGNHSIDEELLGARAQRLIS